MVHTEQMVPTKVKPKKRKACLGSASRAVCLVLGSPRQVAGLLLGLPQATLHQNLTRAAVLQAVLHQGEYTANKQCTHIARNYVNALAQLAGAGVHGVAVDVWVRPAPPARPDPAPPLPAPPQEA